VTDQVDSQKIKFHVSLVARSGTVGPRKRNKKGLEKEVFNLCMKVFQEYGTEVETLCTE
jgi:hypothetical protein